MKKKLNLHKVRGMTILETIIYMSLSIIIICCTLTIMVAIIKKTKEENESSFRVNNLYGTLSTIERYTKAASARNISVKNNVIYFTDKISCTNCEINQQSSTLRLKMNNTSLYFLHNENYNSRVEKFEPIIKGKLLYINIKLETGERLQKCIHIDQ